MAKNIGIMLHFRYNLSANQTTPKGVIPSMSLALNYQNRNSFSKLNPKATFDNDTVSGHPSVTYFQAFLEEIGLPEILANCGSNDRYESVYHLY